MVKVHRQLFDRLGPGTVPAVLLDTPYGFQANARDISARAVSYFRESVRRQVEVASLERAAEAGTVALEAVLARVSEARWVFSGPGSPTYALRQWRPTILPRLLAEKVLYGGCIVFSSAAALTLGRWTVPVYEIYKVGAEPVWADGLDLLTAVGLTVAVIPHFDNAEGGSHDTRYCYLGEERLRVMEAQLPPEGWVLGVDEHTACIFDFNAGTATVTGLGTVTVRRHGQSATIPAGKTLGIDELVELEPAVVEGSPAGEAGPGRARSARLRRPERRAMATGRRPAPPVALCWMKCAGLARLLTPLWPSATQKQPPPPRWSWRGRCTPGPPTLFSRTRSTPPVPRSGAWWCVWENWPDRDFATRATPSPHGSNHSWSSERRPAAATATRTAIASGSAWRRSG